MKPVLIRNGRLVDPASGVDDILDVYVANGKVECIGRGFGYPGIHGGVEVIDAAGLVVAPGLVDLHCHLRVPGFPEKEDMGTGTHAAAAGGFTTVVCMPNTSPVIDSIDVIEYVKSLACDQAVVNVLPAAAVTVGQEGRRLTDIPALAAAGAALFTDDGKPVSDGGLMRTALVKAHAVGRPLAQHSEDRSLTAGGVIAAGSVADRLGVKGIPRSSEASVVARDIVLAKETGAPLHVQHVSNSLTTDVVRFAKAWGAPVTSEVTALALAFTDETAETMGPNAKLKPPFGTEEDRDALREALRDGTIDVIATDHAPHTVAEKAAGLEDAPFGLIGFETALSLVMGDIVRPGVMSLADALAKMTVNPATLLGIGKGRLATGTDADIILIDPERRWTACPDLYMSKARNCPCRGRQMNGKVVMTIVGGKIIYRDPGGH
ncbi:MAG: dihydroorotase [Ignavibacteriales bacterium]